MNSEITVAMWDVGYKKVVSKMTLRCFRPSNLEDRVPFKKGWKEAAKEDSVFSIQHT